MYSANGRGQNNTVLKSQKSLTTSNQSNSTAISAKTKTGNQTSSSSQRLGTVRKAETMSGTSETNSRKNRKAASPIRAWINAPLIDPPAVGTFSDPEALHQPTSGYKLADWIKQIEGLGAAGLVLEYQKIKKEQPSGTFKAYQSYKDKNRYQDVLCYDHTRVKLVDGLANVDYIHANFNDGYKQRKAYICTQGPLTTTFIDFWRMIWQEKVLIIVMTTRMVERDREKCGQYWPTSQKKNMRYGPFIVAIKKVHHDDDYDLSYLMVRHRDTGQERLVTHMLYHAWPDYKVPKSPSAYLSFVRLIHQIQATQTKLQLPDWKGHVLGPPIVIHCSAGIGRTGTFCAIDICVQKMLEVGRVDVAETVRKIRSQRTHSIQTPEQYMFIHLVLIEYAVNSGMYNVEKLDLSGFVDDAAQ